MPTDKEEKKSTPALEHPEDGRNSRRQRRTGEVISPEQGYCVADSSNKGRRTSEEMVKPRRRYTVETDVDAARSAAGAQSGKRPGSGEVSVAPFDSQEVDQYLRDLTDNYRWSKELPRPTDLGRMREELKADLEEVPVLTRDGAVTNVYNKINEDAFLTRQDKELVWNCLAIVREMFWKLENQQSGGYQWNMNWKHTRAEVDQVYDAARLLGLTTRETRDALIASIFSDSIKSRKNFIIHNVHGAQAAAQALSYFLDASKQNDRKSMERVARACKEHQIAPPEFMATIVSIMLHHKHKLSRFNPNATTDGATKHSTILSIYNKIRDPFNESNVAADLRSIAFTENERELLSVIGIKEWYVPHPNDPTSRIAHAVIAGDHSINYNHPEGFAKIALLRGPDTESIFEDPTIHHSLESAVQSFTDSFRVIMPEVQSLALKGLRRTKVAVERVNAIMSEMFNGVVVGPRGSKAPCGFSSIEQAVARAHEKHPNLYHADFCVLSEEGNKYVEGTLRRVGQIMDDWYKEHGNIPFNSKRNSFDEPGPGKLPFWNHPLKYPERDEDGNLVLDNLNELEREQFFFADKIREIAVELLRAEQWVFSLPEH